MKFHSSFEGFDLFTKSSDSETEIVLRLDTPDGMIPVGSSYSSVEEAKEAIKTGWRPNENNQGWLQRKINSLTAR